VSGKVRLGFFSFSEVTDPSEHRAYNEWHQLDHLPQQYQLPGVVLGQRWVCSSECRAAREFDSEVLAPAQYVTLYLMTDPVAATLEEFRELGRTLRRAGRFHTERRACLSGPFALHDSVVSSRALVSADVLPFRPNLGVYVIVEAHNLRDEEHDVVRDEAQSESDVVFADEEAYRWPRDDEIASRLTSSPGVAGVWRFISKGGFEHLGWATGERRITVCYLDEPPLSVSTDLAALVRDVWADRRAPELAGPFETITPWQWNWFDAPADDG
jgi:hypothetical protein